MKTGDLGQEKRLTARNLLFGRGVRRGCHGEDRGLIRYLEGRLIDIAKQTGRSVIINSQIVVGDDCKQGVVRECQIRGLSTPLCNSG